MIALRRDLVVLDCQPPSKMRTKASPISAILLPCRYTVDTPSLLVTVVLLMCQSVLFLMATFISFSILRMTMIVKVYGWTCCSAQRAGMEARSTHAWTLLRRSSRPLKQSSSWIMGQSRARSRSERKASASAAVRETWMLLLMVGVVVNRINIGQMGH